MKRFKLVRLYLALLLCINIISCGGRTPNQTPLNEYYDPNTAHQYVPKPQQTITDPNKLITKTFIKNVKLRVDPNLIANIEYLQGTLYPKRQGDPILFDDVTSFLLYIHKAKLSVDEKSLEYLMNNYVFNYPNAPLSNLKITLIPGKLKMKGDMKKIITIPFEEEGILEPTPDGLIKLIPTSISAGGLPSKGLMDLIGLSTDKLIELNESRGLKIIGNTIIMYPDRMFPPPTMKSKVVAVETQQGKLVMIDDDGISLPIPQLPEPRAKNFKYVYDGNVRLMNETHTCAKLQMIDSDPKDSFDFYLKEYKKHLFAGYVKTVSNDGTLITYMPDYDDLLNGVSYPESGPPSIMNY